VVRGPSWKWGDQDKNGIGFVFALRYWKSHALHAPSDSVTVKWLDGSFNEYRVGAEGATDIVRAPVMPVRALVGESARGPFAH
jgi:hypothetical protein